MNNKIVGIVLIVVGAALALWGYNVYDSAGAQITRTNFSVRFEFVPCLMTTDAA